MLKIAVLAANLRFYSIKHATKNPIKYTSTINLPKTKFPNRLTPAKRDEVERKLLEETFASAYHYQETHNIEPAFVLHDGPPYANGDLHMGHAVNKILKDITIRQHVANKQKIHYKPGWDCHGLPIELKAMAVSGSKEAKAEAVEIRKKCRQFALDTVNRQKEEFRSWGILSDWNNDSADRVYLTLSPDFIINELNMFQNLYESGLIYRDLKPVYWSPSSRTALAEAELEYDPNFVSPSVYVRFALDRWPKNISLANSKIYALVWTTTPWTLPSNQAICYNSDLNYCLVKLESGSKYSSNEMYLLAESLLKEFESVTNISCEIVQTIRGTDLSCCSYANLFYGNQMSLPFIAASHVQDSKGTGLVHTAPAHGPEDFLVSLEHKLGVKCFVDELGCYTKDAPAFLHGKRVLEEGDNCVIQHLANDIVFAGKLTHSYPIDWRTKKPVIIRASEQWFINTDTLKDRAVEEINNIEIFPRVNAEASRKSMISQVRKRPYWCISRQRVWGVPIPVFYEKSTGAIVTNRILLDHICNMIKVEGSIDFWWSRSTKDILPNELLSAINLSADDLVKGSDIFDIWFDSGSTWATALSNEKIADLYLEGYDQFTGWFQSSLLTSIASRNHAPYKSLFVHGFTVDETGRKMSKSLGNVISPQAITKKYGVDVLRWWVASHGTQNMSITVSDRLMQQAADSIHKIRSTLRYLNGVIGTKSDGEGTKELENGSQLYLNKYLLSSLLNYHDEIQKYYDCYEYNRVVMSIQNFVANQISALYVHLIKDRLYCGSHDDLHNIRLTLTKCYEVLCKSLWPITPFLVEESWSYYDTREGFHQRTVEIDPSWKDKHAEEVLNIALDVKRLVNQNAGDVNTWILAVDIRCANCNQLQLLQKLQATLDTPVSDSELCEVLQVNKVTLCSNNSTDSEEYSVATETLDVILCPRCRRFTVERSDCVCVRCQHVLRTK